MNVGININTNTYASIKISVDIRISSYGRRAEVLDAKLNVHSGCHAEAELPGLKLVCVRVWGFVTEVTRFRALVGVLFGDYLGQGEAGSYLQRGLQCRLPKPSLPLIVGCLQELL